MKPTIECLAYQPAVCSDRPTTLQLLVRLHAPKVPRREKPPLNIGLCIDRSGSMGGAPLEHAREAGIHLLEQLAATDRISVVSFDNLIDVEAANRLVGRPDRVIQRLRELFARGGTDLHQGWLETCQQVWSGADLRRLSRVILLSDGQANHGLVDPLRINAQVADWQRKGISTTTVGLGLQYNEDLLAGMARAGNGSFYHVAEPEDIAPVFQIELQSMFCAFGRAVSLDVAGLRGVELLRVINPLEKTRKGRRKLADLVHGCPVDVVMEFLVPAQTREQELVKFRLAWTDIDSGHRRYLGHTLTLPVVPWGQLSEFPVYPEVLHKRAVQLAARVLRKAVALIDQRDYAAARAALQSGIETLKEAGSTPGLLEHRERLVKLLRCLESGGYGSVRKEATFASSSWSVGSVCSSGGVREFMALAPEERTPEKLNELMGFPPFRQSS